MKPLAKYTFGMGDRFAREGGAQMKAIVQARAEGMEICPVWNKSFREHSIIGSHPADVRREADAAVAEAGWKLPYYVDADHVGLATVDGFLESSDFFTLDVADQVGQLPGNDSVKAILSRMSDFGPEVTVPGIVEPLSLTEDSVQAACAKFLSAIEQAGRIYRHIADKKDPDSFVVEVSIDETHSAQTPGELFLILAMVAREGIPAQTIAPKFTGRFNKGVEYEGDLSRFEREFEQDLAVIAFAVQAFDLPHGLKLSVHSGSDKFSLYPLIRKLVQKHGAGLHVKTAGTTWLEEVIGLAESGGEGLALAKEIYIGAFHHFEELTAPYATVISIDRKALPSVEEVNLWNESRFAACLRHDATCPDYHPGFRQLMHVGFKIAAKMGSRYLAALEAHRDIVQRNVTHNLLDRHIRPLFSTKLQS